MAHIFSIEGNIGSGKSTLIKYLKENFRHLSNRNIIYIDEPVDDWADIKDENNETILSKFYHDKEKYAFSFQMMAYITRLVKIKEFTSKHKNAIFITERCLDTDRHVFAKMLYDTNNIEEVNYQIYLKWFDEFIKDYPITGYIYVCTPSEICYERVQKRNRNGETIPLTYLDNCNKYHDNWLNNLNNILILKGTTEISNNLEYSKHKYNIENYITKILFDSLILY
uniref:Deoxynucleoside kinase domain-containing protein n=1 Tax=viral metagenome TaxID=1070528 RepID=A0A6C0KDJ0_9ZZZZ